MKTGGNGVLTGGGVWVRLVGLLVLTNRESVRGRGAAGQAMNGTLERIRRCTRRLWT